MILQTVREKLNYFRQNNFVKSVAFLQVANVAGNFTQALVGVFIARILQPELFGVYAIALSLAGLFFLSTGIQETVVVILGKTYTENDREGTIRALAFFLKFTMVFSAIIVAAALFLPDIAKFFYGNSSIGIYAAVAVLAAIFSSTAFSMSTMILQVTGNIKTMSILMVTDQITRLSLSLLLVFLGYGIFGAVFGHLAGALIIFFVSRTVWSRVSGKYHIFPSWGELFHSIRTVNTGQHLRFSIWAALDKNVAALYGFLPILIVGVFFLRSEVAYFKLALGYIGLALSLLGPISTLLNFEFSRMKIEDPQNMFRNFVKVSLYSMAISAVLTFGAILTAPIVFKILYGSSFLPSVQYVDYFFLYGVFFGIGVGLGPMWRAINKIKVSIMINLLVLGLGIPLGLLLIKTWNLGGAIAMVTILYTVSHFSSFFYLARKLKQNLASTVSLR